MKSIPLLLLLLLPAFMSAVENDTTDLVQQSVEKALQWLRQQQQDSGQVQDGDNSSAMTALAINAHLASGITYYHPQHGPWLRKALHYVLQMQDSKGYFGSRDKSRMYGHGICVLVLAESSGMLGDPATETRVRSALKRALEVTMQAARVEKKDPFRGGWHYNPNSDQADMSLSGWQMLSLHAAEQAGYQVDEAIINGGIAFTRRMCNPKKGSVGYNAPGAARSSLRGVGLLCLTIRKNENDMELSRTIASAIRNDPIQWKGPWFFYRAYYDVAGLGRFYPEHLETYKQHIHEALLSHQDTAGWWHTPPGDNEGRFGKVYRTAMAVLALTLDRQLLPAYQP